jgi:hypothetical protein
MGGRLTWPTQLGTSRAGTNGGCGGCNAPQRKVKGSQLPQLGGPGMLELRNFLNIKEYSEKLRSKKVWKRELFLRWAARGPPKGRGPKCFSYPPPQKKTTHPPTRSCWIHPLGKFGKKYCVLLLLKCYICLPPAGKEILHLHSVAPDTIPYILIYILKFEFFSCFI